MTRLLTLLAAAVTDLALPRSCLGCCRPGDTVCVTCWAATGEPRAFTPDPCPPRFPPTWVAGRYDAVLRSAVLAVKERGRSDLLPLLGAALAGAVAAAAPGSGAVLLVPVPSTRAAVRRRGGDHMRLLARRTTVELQRAGRPVTVLPALRLLRTPQDSAGLSAAERARNLDGVFAAGANTRRLAAGACVVLVDDVVTTGTTLTRCALALGEMGLQVSAAAVAGTTRRSGDRLSG
ncbi:MAG: ComF family protein [Actinomycetota bacterium]|nr:ComF family protein [Actinomycetota bacterium]